MLPHSGHGGAATGFAATGVGAGVGATGGAAGVLARASPGPNENAGASGRERRDVDPSSSAADAGGSSTLGEPPGGVGETTR